MGRPKGSKNKSKETVEKQPSSKRTVMRPIMTGNSFINEDGIIYESHTYFNFKNRTPSPFFYKGDDGSDKKIEGHSIRRDVTSRERDDIMGCSHYDNGLIVEWADNDGDPVNYNSMNDRQIKKVIKEYELLQDKDKFKKYIDRMTSLFALKYFTDKISNVLPGSLIKYCESKIGELEEVESNKNAVIEKKYKKK